MIMFSWLLSVAGVVLVGVMVQLVLTDSAISKFIKSIYAFFVLFVIVQPLPQFIADTSTAVNGGLGYELNEELLQTINNQTAMALQKTCENSLRIAGFENVLVTLSLSEGKNFAIDSVYVNAYGVVLTSNKPNIDIPKDITKIVAMICSVAEDKVFCSI
jgi:hypothetical protein